MRGCELWSETSQIAGMREMESRARSIPADTEVDNEIS